MRFLSVCSGIEAASVAWEPLGWKAVAFSEIEPFPCAVLAHHYPDTPNWGDMTKYKDWPDVSIDLLCGGTPCQSFSVAGLRKGLDDPRGNLMLTFGAIAAKYRPKWLVWENVPGVLSSNGGADFGAFLGMLGQLGYGFAYRVLDAQYFGVAQRRRRVFVVGCLGDWRSAAAVLFERHSMQGHPAPSRKAGKAAPTIPSRSTAGGGLGTDFDLDGGLVMPTMDQRAGRSGANSFATSGGLVPMPHAAISPALKARDHKGVSSDGDGDGAILVPMLAHSLRGGGFDASEDGTGRGTPLVPMFLHTNKGRPDGRRSAHTEMVSVKDIVETLTTDGHAQSAVAVPVAFAENSRHELRLEGGDGQRTGALSTGGGKPGQGVPMIAFPANLSGTQCASTEDLAPSMAVAFGWSEELNALEDLQPTIQRGGAGGRHEGVAYTTKLHNTQSNQAGKVYEEYTVGLDRNSPPPALLTAMQVRRLTPGECESLQGFPQGYTNVPHRNKPAADGPRYKALGNSWAVPNVRWIGQRIDAVALVNTAQPAIKPVAEREAA